MFGLQTACPESSLEKKTLSQNKFCTVPAGLSLKGSPTKVLQNVNRPGPLGDGPLWNETSVPRLVS